MVRSNRQIANKYLLHIFAEVYCRNKLLTSYPPLPTSHRDPPLCRRTGRLRALQSSSGPEGAGHPLCACRDVQLLLAQPSQRRLCHCHRLCHPPPLPTRPHWKQWRRLCATAVPTCQCAAGLRHSDCGGRHLRHGVCHDGGGGHLRVRVCLSDGPLPEEGEEPGPTPDGRGWARGGPRRGAWVLSQFTC